MEIKNGFLPYEYQYFNILHGIDDMGHVEVNKRTGVGVTRIPHGIISVDLENEFPILQSKEVFWKSALEEILWIMQKQSNNIKDLKPKIWDEWADEDGSIGRAYGYQVAKPVTTNDGRSYPNQAKYVLGTLAEDPSDRRCIISLWDVEDMSKMNLNPCCFNTVWTVVGERLNCLLTQRSADFLVGVPFNTTQYAMLTHLFARHLGLRVGVLTHVMADCHIYNYDSHKEGMEIMFDREEEHLAYNQYRNPARFEINSKETDFFKVKSEECKIVNYTHLGRINFDVAV